uniref:Pericentrin/AKAP-450 centrosomal targeting domain-containing protein n=1 Tax=Seriola dumerili TaxID=41447 RepID=A0A3B4UKF2_SERDU
MLYGYNNLLVFLCTVLMKLLYFCLLQPESEVSTTAEDYSSEVRLLLSKCISSPFLQFHGNSNCFSHCQRGTMQDMEDALAAKTQAVEELSRELEEIRAAFGTEGVQQLQDFEAALKQRDGIITQLTANLQQAREEKDEIMKEFLELTEQSQKLHIQFQQLQAGETLRNTSHSSTAADLLQARQQLVQYQQQLEEMNMEVRKHQERSSEQLEHISQLQHKLSEIEMVRSCLEYDKDLIIAEQERVISERDCSVTQLEDELDCKLELEKERVELENCKGELTTSRQKERMSSNEIMQLMGTVEDLQKRCHQGSLSESDTIQKMQEESVRKLELLRAELDEMYGQQIVQMKHELNLQNAAKVEQMIEQHSAELELLKAQLSQSSTAEVDSLNAKIKELQETLEQSQAMHDKTIHELSQVDQEKLNLQVRVEDLLQDLHSAKEKVELVSHSLISQENQQDELQRLQETIDNLKSELAAAQEAAQEAETKHESEVTNYKIKLEMLEREKDAVLDRMAESQEAELERLRTQLLFSHEEELTHLREELQREGFLNTENLLNEAAIKHERASDELRFIYEEELHLLRGEKASFATERDELLHQILGLKEDLNLALHSSKADELVQQLQELQVELEELRKGGEERARMENEIQALLKKTEVLEKQTKEKEQCWENQCQEQELEKKTLIESNNTLKEELDSKIMKIETVTAEKNQIQQQVDELREEIEKQRTTFSFAEKNFDVNYQELKEEYMCLIEAKTQLEERTLKETLEFEAKIASLQSQIQELEESSRDIKMEDADTDSKALLEKDTTELMEKLNVTLSEKDSLAGRLSEVTEQLMFTESKVGQLEEELVEVKKENTKVIAQNESLGKELDKKQQIMREQTRGQDAQRKFHVIDSSLSYPVEYREFDISPLYRSDPEEQAGAPSPSITKELQRLKVEAQEKQLQLEESHRQEMEHLRAHYQQQATETEERYATELFMLQQRLQEVTAIVGSVLIVLQMNCYYNLKHFYIFSELHFRYLILVGINYMFSLVFRNLLRKANEKLSQVLVDVLKTTAAAEETMGLHMQSLDKISEWSFALNLSSVCDAFLLSVPLVTPGHSAESWHSSDTSADDMSLWSGETEAHESLEVSQQMMDSLLLGAGTQLENEEYLMGISSRLQTALEKMLMTITDTTNQLEHARMTQTELMRESFRHNQEMSELLQKQEELQERVSEEARAREQLALELHRAEGLIDGYTGERAALEEQLRQKEELQLSLEQELQVTSSRLHELEQERLQMQEERELLSRQQDAMREHAGPHLLEETEKLMKEKVEVQRQAEKENSDLLKQVKLLEAELEEQVNRVIELEHAQRTESGDQQQQIQALEKQLEKNRKFLDEQAVDREHERDFFQQEIQKLEQQLKNPQKLQTGSEQRNQEVDQLTSQLKEKADWCSELLLSSEQLRRELGERDEEIDKLESRIRELEQALLASAESLEKVRKGRGGGEGGMKDTRHSTLEAQLQTEREALERKEKEIGNLEEQLEQFREELENKSEEVQQLQMQLEIQRKEISSQQQYLETRDSMLQVNRHPVVMEEKDREIALLNEQITKLQHMETASDNKEIDERDELIKDLESQVECLRSEQERLKRNNEEEFDQLNAVIDKLQQELANIEQKQVAEEDEDDKGEPESGEWGPGKEEYDEMKQRMDLATKELDTLKTEHSKLLETYLRLKESAEALAETEKMDGSEGDLEEALREKTAGLVVMQAQVQALEQSATNRVEELGVRIQELEDLVAERDSELSRCRLLVEQTQSYVDGLQQKVSSLEENLREKVAEVLVSQATLEAFQQQQQQQQQQTQGTKESQDLQRDAEPHVHGFGDFGIPQMDFSGLGQAGHVPTGKVVHLTQRLRELEVGLSGMQKDQELQKQLLSSSEEEVLEYERRLAVLMDLLSQMKARSHQITSPAVEVRVQPLSVKILRAFKLSQEIEVKKDAESTKEELNSYRQHNEKLQEELQVREVSISELKEELQELRKNVDTTKEELNSHRQHNEKLQDALHVRELSISKLKDELQEVQTALMKAADSDSFTQTEPFQMSDLSPESKSATKEEMEEVIGEFQEKIVQMQELHAAEILDMEARHISESENLRRDTHALEDECKALKAVIDKLRSTEVRTGNRKEVFLLQENFCALADSSSDYSQRTGYDLPSLQQEFRTTPEGARRETDDPLPDRIKMLLREVHQEGMQVLSLSELPLSEGEPGGQFNIQGWVKERDALLATVESLKGLITQIMTRFTQISTSQKPKSLKQVFLRERSVLKNALYSQLDLLDTSDAIIYLNQLERRLAEQVSHNDSMGSLLTAERSSLISEIHQLRGQLEQLHQGEPPAVSMAAECSVKEQREGGGADGAAEADRLLVEELKGELSQTKLELETTLKTQHKHLKELDTLRAEVSKKAAEVDAFNDQLTEERKRNRDLQWAMEKEKCRTGRTEESKQEELEDLHLSLEEQKSRVAQLTVSLDQERQALFQLSQQAEQERLSLHRRLQELQVQLETERAKAQEMSTALGRERELRTGVSSGSEEPVEERKRLEEEGSVLRRLQRELDDKHAQVVHLLSQVEAEKLEVVRKEEEMTLASQRSRRDQETLLEARAQLESLEVRMSATQEQLEREVERRKSLEEEKERLEEKLTRAGQREGSGPQQADSHSVSITESHHFIYSNIYRGSSSSSNSLTERLLRQNAELTGFVSRLTEEKNDLRNHTLRLEEELRRYRQAGLGSGDSVRVSKMDSASMLLSQEREAWTREKVRLEKALHLSQSQVARLRGEIRTDTLREITGPEADNAALKRMYGKYLRSESFRKALIYQKKYLLLLLGGFQECEEATLSLLSRMGSRPSVSSLESLSQRRRGLMRFRSAVRVSIALSRMRFLVKRWHKATGMSSTASCGVNKNGTGQTLGTEARDSPYLHPGSVEMYRERGSGGGVISSSRGRNHGALTCSHLQSYDPDRALTDYISRLEALQRRLGNVTSGASSYAQLHFGLRR